MQYVLFLKMSRLRNKSSKNEAVIEQTGAHGTHLVRGLPHSWQKSDWQEGQWWNQYATAMSLEQTSHETAAEPGYGLVFFHCIVCPALQ